MRYRLLKTITNSGKDLRYNITKDIELSPESYSRTIDLIVALNKKLVELQKITKNKCSITYSLEEVPEDKEAETRMLNYLNTILRDVSTDNELLKRL